jgi:sporulation protein YlmC with PRC-barrel domain
MARRKTTTGGASGLTPFREILQDEHNANRGTKRGGEVIRKSLQEYGAGRSVLLDKNNRLIAGNKTLGQAALGKSGIKGVRIIETDGTELIAVKRIDLDLETDSKAKALAVADNRAGEISLEWDRDVLKSLEIDLSPFWDEKELKGLLEDAPESKAVDYQPGFALMVEEITEAQQLDLLERLGKEGLKCRALTF